MKHLLVIAWFLFLSPYSLPASIVSGGFETGNLNGWSSIRDVRYGVGIPRNHQYVTLGGSDLYYFSGIKTTLQANNGDQLSYRWDLFPYPGTFVLDGDVFCLGRTHCYSGKLELPRNPGFSAEYERQTGYESLTVPITTTALYTVGFAAFDHSDQEGAAALLIDASVPEPSTLVLLGFGLIGLAAWGRRKLNR